MVSDNEEEEIAAENKFLLEALTKRMEKMMDEKLEVLRQDKQTHSSDNQREPRRNRRERQEHAGSQETGNYYERDRERHISASRHSSRRTSRDHEGRRYQRDELAGLKLKIPPFHGKANPDAYLEWEKRLI